jgi:hypothetical protein
MPIYCVQCHRNPDAIAAHLPEDIRALFLAEEPRTVAGAALVCVVTLTTQPEHGGWDEAAPGATFDWLQEADLRGPAQQS